jgi:N-acetyl-gamma-glutamyl-phosphate reductase
MTNVFIDGQVGTTGLKILERFKNRSDIKILTIEEKDRKNTSARKELINASDFTFLCLPDDAAIEAVSLIENPNVRVIDASTAHRTNPDWAYGFPELSKKHREKIQSSNRVAVPGCYAGGAAAILYPLVTEGVVEADYPVVIHAISGYSGAGKAVIAQYEDENRDNALSSPRQYALTQNHKHLKEIKAISGLGQFPIFNPYIADFYSGMTVSIPLFSGLMKKKMSMDKLFDFYWSYYENQPMMLINAEKNKELIQNGFLPANVMSGDNRMELFVYGNDERIVISTRFDNLGKGASGAAVQCMNIMLGLDETTGLL